jgi:hypothetical protein
MKPSEITQEVSALIEPYIQKHCTAGRNGSDADTGSARLQPLEESTASKSLYLPAFTAAHRFFCAARILRLAAALT